MKTNDRPNTSALVSDVQRFCMHDGPGVRTTVFFKGCPLSCKWCHNPETQSGSPEILFAPSQCVSCGACARICEHNAQISAPGRRFDRALCLSCGKCAAVCPSRALTLSGKRMTVGEILREVEKDAAFYGENGGLTVSGGEPTAQKEALFALLGEAKSAGIGTAIETCGVFPPPIVGELCALCDLFLFDIKDTDGARLRANTGADLGTVLSNLRAIDAAGGETVLRCIMIPDVNMDAGHLRRIAGLYGELPHCRYVELLPYHPFGASKAGQLGRTAPTVYRKPEKDELAAMAGILAAEGVPTKIYGAMQPRDTAPKG